MILLLIQGVIALLTGIVESLDTSALNTWCSEFKELSVPQYFRTAMYFFDIDVLLKLLQMEVGWISFKILWSVLLRIKSFIPTLGGT